MPYEQRDSSGSIFPNEKKTSDKHPGWKGLAKIGGVDYWVSGWVRKTKNGDKYVSLAFEVKDAPQQHAASHDHQAPADNEIPF